jgi:hypothetical protein
VASVGVLAVLWMVVLGPPAFRHFRRSDRRVDDSTLNFHRQLRIIQRAGPNLIPAANRRLVAGERAGALTANLGAIPNPASPVSGYGSPAALRRPATRRMGSPTSVAEASRSRTLHRRRSVLVSLAGATAFFFLLGLVLVMHVLLVLAGALGVLLAAYVGMLVRIRNLAAERDMKVAFLPGGSFDEGPLLRRSATN